MHRVIRRSLIVAAATLMPCFAGVSQAAPATQTASAAQASSARPLKLTHATKRKAHRARKSSRYRHTERRARATTRAVKVEETQKREVAKQEAPPEPSTLEPSRRESSTPESSVANAHAELTPGDPQSPTPPSVPMQSDKTVSGDATAGNIQIADQLNQIDRDANAATATPSPSVSMASYSERPAIFAQTATNDDAWDQASLIGKIFIAFGTLLTLASAARLMMA
ncbi:MAG: hypothetical protein J0G95_17945 [Rhizobiales bacterium]|nr:hypothetical protein [Hyphomicrobiales bacterium]